MLNTKKMLTKIAENMNEPIKVVKFGWVVSNAGNAKTRILQGGNPSNSTNPSAVPSGYTFACWLQFISNGWVGCVTADNYMNQTVNLWISTEKPATTGESVQGWALYIRNDLV